MGEKREFQYIPELGVELCHFKNITQSFPTHFHEHYTMGILTKGTWLSVSETEEIAASSGTAILINPYESHSCKQLVDGEFEYFGINITPDSIKKNIMVEDQSYEPFLFWRSSCQDIKIEKLFLDVFFYDTQGPLVMQEKIFYLLENLIQLDAKKAPAEKNISERTIRAIAKMLDLNYNQRFSLDDLSTKFGGSKYQILRSFTKCIGLSPYRYLESLRINHAKTFLQAGVKPIDVCYDVGFTDQSQFTKAFKRIIGATPKQYQLSYIER